ncbi:hypothetical protein CsatB_011158 [Cannabis sativa]|uniref:RING-type domain-containing protein n=2 Tax=Cannabis sativa TaxID=3483 RepID=A0A7J6E6J2_CANSA|nr:hypothetical protein F8388_002463 [Cannabis sativa]KAF4401223.1 hypothetical protein G4B88_014064 [Cannabis sativa]
MDSITASSPSSSSSSSSSSSFINETAYIIIFSIGLTLVILTIAIAFSYFCRGEVWSPTTDLQHQRASPIAATSPSNPSQAVMTGNIKEGLDEGLLSTYPKLKYSQVLKQQGLINLSAGSSSSSGGGCCCSICLVDYKDDDTLLVLPDCAHFYHVNCGFRWLRLHPTCPVCRKLANPTSSVELISHHHQDDDHVV